MARDGLFALLCAGAVALAGPATPAHAAPGEDSNSVATALAVQTAMQQGRDFLQRGDSKSAVRVLEEQLPKINGNATYLNLLRDAYRGLIRDLKLARQDAEAQRFFQRLQIVDPGAVLDGSNARGANTISPADAVPARIVPRGKVDDERDPFQDVRPKSAALLKRAEEAFAAMRYREAAALFEQAGQGGEAMPDASRGRWSWCLLEGVAGQVNKATDAGAPWDELEREARRAVELTPPGNVHLQQFGKDVLAEIDKRRSAEAPPVKVSHFERNPEGWARAETTNFRIFHNQSREFVEQVAQVAERTRLTMARKWFGGFKDAWDPRCDIYLHATAQDYSKATGVPTGSPGHSSFRTDGSRVLSRRVDLHCEDPKNLLGAVLPHEATHVVLAGQFGEQAIPRWADEGIAVLTEPREKVERHIRNMARCKQEVGLFSVKQLMQMADYPEARYVTVFYAQSVSLVDFLTEKSGPETLTKFLRAALKDGYEPALRTHYGYRSFDEMQQDWHKKVFAAVEIIPAAAQAGR